MQVVDLERYRYVVPDWDRFVAAAGRPEPAVLRVRTGRVSPARLVERLAARGFSLRPLDGMDSFLHVVDGPGPISATLEHWLGLFYVQQASTGVAAPALGPRPGERVLDLCSAPGGKTTHAAQLMEDRGCLVASEISESRIRGLLGNVYRLGHPNILVTAGDGRAFPEGALFDRVLVDAPCSGEGTLRRRGGRAPRQSRSFLGYVTGAQRGLLEKAIRLTRPGGTILYVTCTFAPEENEAVVHDVLATQPVELVPLELPVPHAPGLTSFGDTRYDARLEGAARIYPHHLDSGGLFLVKLRKVDDGLADDPSAGWGPVPAVFPGDPTEGAAERLETALEDLHGRFGVAPERLDGLEWIQRGGRAWLHALGEWPLDGWEEGAWRAISVGYRAVDFDSRGRPRPSNDLLRTLGDAVRSRKVALDREDLLRLLRREPVEVAADRSRGPVAVEYGGDALGRAAVTGEGLKSEIPKARAADLLRVLDG